MPRLIDKLDSASGLLPDVLEHDIDYLTKQPSPDKLITEDGVYNAGWYDDFEGAYNFEDSYAIGISRQQWFHVSLDTPDYFVIFNIADLTRAGNTALLLANKNTGAFHEASITRIFPRNNIQVSADSRHFHDPDSTSFVEVSADRQLFSLSIHVEDLHLIAKARPALGNPFVQVSRYQRARGAIQRYGCLEVIEGIFRIGNNIHSLPPGTLGTFDHTIGHQRGIQGWNWIALVGRATCLESGEVSQIGIQVARDRKEAKPRVETKKYVIWVNGRMVKVATAAFDYTLDPKTKSSSHWRIHSPIKKKRWIDLHFVPKFHRREQKYLWLVKADFNQYYGIVTGEVHIDGRTWQLHEQFAVTEESLLEM